MLSARGSQTLQNASEDQEVLHEALRTRLAIAVLVQIVRSANDLGMAALAALERLASVIAGLELVTYLDLLWLSALSIRPFQVAQEVLLVLHDSRMAQPNVSAIDFREVLKTIQDVMAKVTLAITVVGGLVLFSGGLILIGAVAMTKFQRVYEAAVFKTLGANVWSGGRLLVSRAGSVFDAQGVLVDEKVREALRKFLADFVASLPRRAAQ